MGFNSEFKGLIITVVGPEGHVETAMVEQLSTVYTEDGEEIFWFWFDIARDASTEISFLF